MTAPASAEVPRPSSLEVLANLLLGPRPGAPPLPPAAMGGVLPALERAILPALERPPCLVSFSGGRDSSAILAAAVHLARRHGLEEPLPASMRFPAAPESDEADWQRLVLAHLEVRSHEVLELRDELDALGPAASSALLRDGVRWPANAYMHVPLLDLARGGALLTGAGGDELLGTRSSPHLAAVRRRALLHPANARSLASAALPRRLRALLWRARRAPDHPWLTAAGAKAVNRALAHEEVSWPHRWDASVEHWYRSRAFAALNGSLATMAADRDVAVVNPFLHPDVLSKLAAAGGPTGFPSRSAAMQHLFGALLPAEVLSRGTKAAFSSPLWGPAARSFAAEWDGRGVGEQHVDVAALRGEWLSERPNFRTVLLLHTAWRHGHGRGQASASRS